MCVGSGGGRPDSAPLRGAVRPPEGDEGRRQTGWARDWLRGVAEARAALERARVVAEMRRERALCMGSPMSGGPSGKGGTNAAEASMIGYVASEEDLAATYAWAQAELDAFDAMAEANRRCLRGAILDGLDVAEVKYRIGLTDREAARALGVSRSKLHTDLAAFADYLDFIGRDKAFAAS